MARILLVRTRGNNTGLTRAATPPLGLMYLAAYARRRRKKDEYLLVDERIGRETDEEWRKKVDGFSPDLIAISSLTAEADRLSELIGLFREIAGDVPLALGGPHATAYGRAALELAPVDYIVRGEGETAFLKLLDCLDRGERYPDQKISGLLFRRPDGTIVENAPNADLIDLDEAPPPAWDLADIDGYARMYRMNPLGKSRYGALFTSRGCPYRCIYCHSIFPKKFRGMSPKKTVDEIQYLKRTYGLEHFEIYDDIFNADRGRVEAICDELIGRRLNVELAFPNGVRGDRLDAKLLSRLRSAGAGMMSFAIESASPRIQKLVRKNIDLDLLRANISTAARLGIFSWGFFMLGFPTETRSEIRTTLDYAFNSDLHGAFFFSVIPFAGTQLAGEYGGMASADALASDYYYSENTMSEVSGPELSSWQLYAYSRFFSSPARVKRVLADYPFARAQLFSQALRFLSFVGYHKPAALVRNLLGGSGGRARRK